MTNVVAADLKGKRALVTGGSRGIGRAIAVGLANCGAEIAVNYQTDANSANETVKCIEQIGGRAFSVQADVSKRSDVERMFEQLRTRFDNCLDILINNAGSLKRFTLDQLPESEWDRSFANNAKSVFLCTQTALSMFPNEHGRIVNVTSISARNGGAVDSIHYAAAKGAVSTFTRACAKALAPRGITVNGIAPGVIMTDFHKRNTDEAVLQTVKSNVPLRRLGIADDCVAAVQMLCGPQASYITGEIIEINGGLLMD